MQNKIFFRIYTYLNLSIQKYLFRKKIVSIDFFSSKVIVKKSSINNPFNLECAKLVCKYYRENLDLDFSISYLDNHYCIKCPFLKVGYRKNYNFSKTTLAQYILKNSRILNNLRIINKNIVFEIVWLDCHKHNCFVYNNEVYPLDLESFAFRAYNCLGNQVLSLSRCLEYTPKKITVNNQMYFIV